jgi:hypothetical protein
MNEPQQKLFFGLGNAKLSTLIATFSLPAGWTCPCANECLSKADRYTGKITDGPNINFRCYAATNECRATTVRNARWRNFELLKTAKTVQGMADLIQQSLPWGITFVRVHPSGDFFNETYFKAWLNVALNNPELIVYGYTKTLNWIVKYKSVMPSNFRLTASKGGKLDALIQQHNLVSAEVVFSTEEARLKGLEIDHDDSHAIKNDKSYGLLLHGTQPVNSVAGEAWKVIKKLIGGYSRNGNIKRSTAQPAKPVKLVVA